MDKEETKGRWAVVTGASSGFGADFARELATYDCNLVITARREERLGALKEEIKQKHAISVDVIPKDLIADQAPQQLYEQIKSKGIDIDVLINNAGFGLYGEFVALDWEDQKAMLRLNILALTQITWLFVHPMIERNSGFISHVASNSAYQPSPLYATYGAIKSFVLNFSFALRNELRGTAVKCSAISPGPMVTEFQQVSGQDKNHPYIRLNKVTSGQVAKGGIDAMLKGKASLIPGWSVALTAWLSQRAPTRWSTALTGCLMRLQPR